MRNKLILALSTIAVIAAVSCKKDADTDNNSNNNNTNTCVADTGGMVTVVAFPAHHGKPIVSSEAYRDTVYVKFNSLELPTKNGVVDYSAFDMKVAGDAGENHVHITHLKCGKYYFYATGIDSGIVSGTQSGRVSGGISKEITQTEGEVILDVPVTEGD